MSTHAAYNVCERTGQVVIDSRRGPFSPRQGPSKAAILNLF